MADLNRLAAAIVGGLPPSRRMTVEETERLAEKIASIFRAFPAAPPSTGETCAITPQSPKMAGLFFDRVWGLPPEDVSPSVQNIFFYCATDPEIWWLGALTLSRFKMQGLITDDDLVSFLAQSPLPPYIPDKILPSGANILANALYSACGINSRLVLGNRQELQSTYQEGASECISAAVSNIGIVSEDKLQWDQVVEFRSDNESKSKLRRMRHWLDREMIGKSVQYINDEIETRLEDYEFALKKHGIETFAGTITDLLDPSFLKAAVPAIGLVLAGELFAGLGTGLAALAAGGLAMGKVTASLTTRYLDLADRKRGQGSEVAVIHELKKLTK